MAFSCMCYLNAFVLMIKKYAYDSCKVQMAILQDTQSKVDIFRPVAVL